MLRRLPAIQGPRGRPRRKPKTLAGDRGYGFRSIIEAVESMGIRSQLSPRHIAHGSGLGRVRYVVEQTLAGLGHCRRIKLCYEKTAEHFQAFNELASDLMCAKRLHQVTAGL